MLSIIRWIFRQAVRGTLGQIIKSVLEELGVWKFVIAIPVSVIVAVMAMAEGRQSIAIALMFVVMAATLVILHFGPSWYESLWERFFGAEKPKISLEVVPVDGPRVVATTRMSFAQTAHFSPCRQYLCEIGVKNLHSDKSIKDVIVKIMRFENEPLFHAPQTLLTKHVTIHPLDTSQFPLANCEHAALGETLNVLVEVSQHGKKYTTVDPWTKLTVQAFGEDAQSEPQDFFFGIDLENRPVFEPWDEGQHSLKLPPRPNMPLREAVNDWLLDKSEWGIGKNHNEALGELRQAAANGEIWVWGRRKRTGMDDLTYDGTDTPLIPISKDYWIDGDFDPIHCLLEDAPSGCRTQPDAGVDESEFTTYQDVRVNLSQIQSRWHKIGPETERQLRAFRISNLYAEGVELRNRAASLRVLDAATQARMDELQEWLAKEMRDLAPEQAINLDTLNTYKLEDHPPMVLQDSKRTLEFSEFLRRVQHILAGYK